MSKRVTIKDLAKKLNVNTSTVSRALNNHPAISDETKKKVQELADKLNYYPNQLALNLRHQKTNTVGVVVPEITSHFFSSVITGVQDILGEAGYSVIICQSNESYKEEVSIVENLIKIGVDGVLISPSARTKKFNHLKKLKKQNTPLVVFDRDCPGLEVDKVLVDDYDGAFQAVEHLIKSGCKRIAHIAGPKHLSTTNHRLNGYFDALKKHDVPVNNDYIKYVSGFTHDDGIKPAKKLLRMENRPDAIFATNDNIAISTMHVARKLQLKIPEQVSIIGFDDEPHSAYFKPALSTIWQPVFSMGMLSARVLLKRLTSPNSIKELRQETFKSELIIRESCK